jgi:hypothetical protein
MALRTASMSRRRKSTKRRIPYISVWCASSSQQSNFDGSLPRRLPRREPDAAVRRKPQTVRARLSSPALAFATMPWKHRPVSRPAGAIHPRPVEYPRGDHRQESRFPILGRHMGGHHDITRAADADRAWRAGGIREGSYPRADGRRPSPRCGARREDGTTAEANTTPAARGDQAPRPGRGSLTEIGRSYNGSAAPISRPAQTIPEH